MLEGCNSALFTNKSMMPMGGPDYIWGGDLSDDTASFKIPAIRNLLIGLYATMSSLGVLFNVIVIVALLQHRSLSNLTNVFVLTLAISDVILCAVNIPVQAFYDLAKETQMTSVLCGIIFSGFGLPMYISCLTIMIIAIDRHHMIIYPLSRYRMTRRLAVGLIVIVVIFSVVSSIPVGMHMSTRNDGRNNYCIESWPSIRLRFVYSSTIFIIQFFAPLLVSVILYLRIYIRLGQRTLVKKEAERKNRTNKILMAVVACFAICWTPWCIYSLLLEYNAFLKTSEKSSANTLQSGCQQVISVMEGKTNKGRALVPQKHFKLIDLVLRLFAMGSACVNPFLYGWLNEPIRASMCRLWCRILARPLAPTEESASHVKTHNVNLARLPNQATIKTRLNSIDSNIRVNAALSQSSGVNNNNNNITVLTNLLPLSSTDQPQQSSLSVGNHIRSSISTGLSAISTTPRLSVDEEPEKGDLMELIPIATTTTAAVAVAGTPNTGDNCLAHEHLLYSRGPTSWETTHLTTAIVTPDYSMPPTNGNGDEDGRGDQVLTIIDENEESDRTRAVANQNEASRYNKHPIVIIAHNNQISRNGSVV